MEDTAHDLEEFEEFLDGKELVWSSDWGGDEIGYDDVLIVGLYQVADTETYVYLNAETGEILEAWTVNEE